ncbi:MAG: hypothetical protein H6613_17905 [Ignavibacteriales bacterium]|nr:hypothetical protein [Ignavibacteriales bacterium]
MLINYKNHSEKFELLKSGKLSLVENVKNFLSKIEQNKDINAFNFVFNDCIETAEKVQQKFKMDQPAD